MIFWGTFFPLISEALTGTEESVGPPFFNGIIAPLALVLVRCRRSGRSSPGGATRSATLRRAFQSSRSSPALSRSSCCWRSRRPGTARPRSLMFTLAAFVAAVVAQEFLRGARARRTMTGEPPPVALSRLVGRNRRRYGGYMVHVGIAVLAPGRGRFVVVQRARRTSGSSRARR